MSLNAFVTLVTTDSYVPGALVNVHSLLEVEGTKPAHPFETVCLVTPATVSVQSIKALRRNFSLVVGVEEIRSGSNKELQLLGRQDLASTLTKLHLFRLIQFRRIIFLDADTLALQPLSHLFALDAPFSAAPDSGWPDCFNSGMFVATPSVATFDGLMEMAAQRGSWDGGDQGLLNDYFPDWNRLSFTYNVTPSAYYTYAPAYRRHGQGIRLVHFIGSHKPWHEPGPSRNVPSSSENEGASDYASLVNRWFGVYQRYVAPTQTQKTFTFPTLQATWDAPKGRVTPYTPPSLEDLKRTFQGVFASQASSYSGSNSSYGAQQLAGNALEGHYVSMPLKAGRPDLLGNIVFTPPQPKGTSVPQMSDAPVQPPPESAGLPSSISASTHGGASSTVYAASTLPPDVSIPPSHIALPSPPEGRVSPPSPPRWSPPNVNWDPARSEPPKNDRPQMEAGFNQQYDNVWDSRPSKSSKAFFKAPETYGAIPKVTHQDYKQFTKGYRQPDQLEQQRQQEVKPVFPWESQQNPPKPTRVFPTEPPRRPHRPVQPSQAPSAPSGATVRSGPHGTTHTPTPHTTFSTAGLSSTYTNAWDNVASIKRYADHLKGGHSGSSGRTQTRPQHHHSHQQPHHHHQQQTGSVDSKPRHLRHTSDIGPNAGYAAQYQAHTRSSGSSPLASATDRPGQPTRTGSASASEPSALMAASSGGSSPRKEGYEKGGEASSRDGDDEDEDDDEDEEANTASSSQGKKAPSSGKTTAGRGTRSPPHYYYTQQQQQQQQRATQPVGGGRGSNGGSGANSPVAAYSPNLPDPSTGNYRGVAVSRVFDPKTNTDVIRKEGLDALHRFVKSMEAKGAAVNAQQQQQRPSSPSQQHR